MYHQSSSEEFAEKLGLTIRNGRLHQLDGLFHDESKVIVINENVRLDQRRRFTSFHEMFHFLLRNDDEFFSELNDLYDEEFRWIEEKLCNIGASEFLSPREQVYALIAEQGFSINLLLELEENFNLYKPSAMWRLAECADHPCILAICRAEYDIFPVLKIEAKEIKVESAWNSEWTPYKLKIGTSIPKNHPIWNTTQSLDDGFSFENSFVQFYTGKQIDANVEGLWINGRAYIMFNLK